MLINYNLDALNKLFTGFHDLTGLSVSIWDTDFNNLAIQPKGAEFCDLIQATREGKRKCEQCDVTLMQRCALTKTICTHVCHMGLIDVAVPILSGDATLLGIILFGQIRPGTDDEEGKKIISAAAEKFGIDYDKLHSSYPKLKHLTASDIESAAQILNACVQYIWSSSFISINYNFIAYNIKSYLEQNINEDLSISKICSKFNISKNFLYSIAHKFFNMTVSQYILKLRISKAKHLLLQNDDPIYMVSTKVGISDYNYFSKIFKKETGLTPKAYRKQNKKM